MLYEPHEVNGTELPIYSKEQEGVFTKEHISELGESMNNYKHSGFVKVIKYNQTMYTPVYSARS